MAESSRPQLASDSLYSGLSRTDWTALCRAGVNGEPFFQADGGHVVRAGIHLRRQERESIRLLLLSPNQLGCVCKDAVSPPGAIGIVAIMMLSDSGRTQVFTSLAAAGALVLFWPVARKRIALQKEEAGDLSSALPETHRKRHTLTEGCGPGSCGIPGRSLLLQLGQCFAHDGGTGLPLLLHLGEVAALLGHRRRTFSSCHRLQRS
jgi:hypothetical protein